MKGDREQTFSVDKYPRLDPEDERRNMMDREILEKFIDLRTSCLNKEEQKKVMDMLYKYIYYVETHSQVQMSYA